MSPSPPLYGHAGSATAPSDQPTRRFVVEPVETSSKSNRSKPKRQARERSASPPRTIRRFKPELAESSTRSTRKDAIQMQPPTRQGLKIQDTNASPTTDSPNSRVQVKPRRFAPQLIETTKRSRKSGDLQPAHLPSDKTDLSPGDPVYIPRHLHAARPPHLPAAPENAPITCPSSLPHLSTAPENVPITRPNSSPLQPESRFSSANLSRKAPRRTSFRVPELQPIVSSESSESDESTCQSLPTSPAHSDHGQIPKHKKQARESCDDRFSGYFLALAAKAAQVQLREQALAGFPNEREQEHVDHFAIDQDSDDPISRRESAAGWDLAEMRKHQEKLEQQRRRAGERPPDPDAKGNINAIQDRQTGEERPTGFVTVQNLPKLNAEDEKRMRKALSPPMLGGDIQFPKSLSPQATHLVVDQYPRQHVNNQARSRNHSGLWTPDSGPSRKPSAIGLWRGVCTAHDTTLSPARLLQTGLMTPRVERDDPFASLTSPSWPSGSNPLATRNELPPTPSQSFERKDSIFDDPAYLKVRLEEQLDTDFNDAFVTQVYNYLSIGYPSLARKYDPELSKISKIPIEELRKDDGRKNTKGYVGAPEGADAREPGPCMRWKALRLYVREWGRQQPLMKADGESGWGERGRKGSWAI